jgi:phasin family protein
MQNELIQQWTELNKSAMEAIKELGEINTNAMTRLTQRQMDMVSLYMEGSAKQLEALSQSKGVPDIISAQSRIFSELNEKLMENARQTLEVLVEVKSELSSWVEKSMQSASSNLPKVAPKK